MLLNEAAIAICDVDGDDVLTVFMEERERERTHVLMETTLFQAISETETSFWSNMWFRQQNQSELSLNRCEKHVITSFYILKVEVVLSLALH